MPDDQCPMIEIFFLFYTPSATDWLQSSPILYLRLNLIWSGWLSVAVVECGDTARVAVNLSQVSQLWALSISHSLLGLHCAAIYDIVYILTHNNGTWSPSVFSHFPRDFPPPKTFISPISHPPWNSISLKLRNYSKKYLSVIFMGWGWQQQQLHCSGTFMRCLRIKILTNKTIHPSTEQTEKIFITQNSWIKILFMKNIIKKFKLKVQVSKRQSRLLPALFSTHKTWV